MRFYAAGVVMAFDHLHGRLADQCRGEAELGPEAFSSLLRKEDLVP